MIITLNDQLQENSHEYKDTVDGFYNKVMRKLPTLNASQQYKVVNGLRGEAEYLHLGFLEYVSNSYSKHQKITIAPHDIWYVVLTEIASLIKANAQKCQSLFTRSDSKVEISVPTGDVTTINLASVVDQFKSLVPVDVNIFVPEFSTHDHDSRLACYAALCDGLQVYYNYSTFCCGIPQIKLTGTIEDWKLISSSIDTVAKMFYSVDLPLVGLYLIAVKKLVEDITIAVEDPTFLSNENYKMWWLDIFSRNNVGSGGQFNISGWITKLFYKIPQMPRIENFSSTISVVPYHNQETQRNFIGAHGAFKRIRDEDGFVRCGYGEIVYEVINK